MKFVELTVTTTNEAEELVADIFWEYTNYGVAISAVDEVIKLLNGKVIYDYYDKSILEGVKGVSIVKGYFEINGAEEKVNSVRIRLNEMAKTCALNYGTLETVVRVVDGDDWLAIWKKHFKPINFGLITICPEWIDCKADNVVVKIDSNMAFGTGEHETTSMVINSMQPYIMQNTEMLDIGTGSGILGISGAMLGAKKVVMTDIDEVACAVAKKNAVLNGVEDRCEILCQGDLNKIEKTFDLVVANITCEVLTVLASSMCSVTKKGGRLVLSGILNDRVERAVNAFIVCGCKLVSKNSVGEWSSVVLEKL